MSVESKVYIAGVGCSPLQSKDSPSKNVGRSLISAATKALLDAGISYDDITRGVRGVESKRGGSKSDVFDTFDAGAITVDEVKDGSELEMSVHLIRDQNVQCVLVTTLDKSNAVAFVIVSDRFLWRHPYLKDSAILIRQSDAPRSISEGQAGTDFYHVCQIVWRLRGWSDAQAKSKTGSSTHYKTTSNQHFQLSRADANAIPDWQDVEYKQDGKHRLGYNPATETREVSHEDFEAVGPSGKSRKKTHDHPQFDRKGGDRAVLAKL